MSTSPSDLDERARLAALDAVSRSKELFGNYVLKGGLALRYAHGSPRKSDDLDFDAIADHERARSEENEHELVRFCHRLDAALEEVRGKHGFTRMVVQRKRLSDEIPTILAELGHSVDGKVTPPLRHSVPMQVTLCEVVCEVVVREVEGIKIRVPTLEDILAEKIKAMAQQVQRRNARSSDVFDIWYFAQERRQPLDHQKLSEHLAAKVRPLNLKVSAESFKNQILRAFSGSEYADLAADLPRDFDLPPFEDAYEAVVDLVEEVGEVGMA